MVQNLEPFETIEEEEEVTEVSSLNKPTGVQQGIRRKSRAIVICCCILIFVLLIAIGLFFAAMGILYSRIPMNRVDFEGEPWPVKDEDGYYQSYKEGNTWVNWWHKDMPSGPVIVSSFALSKDESSIPSDTKELDKTLPIEKPYWLTNPDRQVGAEGVRGTWIGHASVLVEVDGAIILTDPIFSERCSPFQWAGPKRYRPPACTVEELPDIVDAVVISHTHYDHLDYNSVLALHKRYGDKIHWFVPGGSKSWFEETGIASENIHDHVWWQSKVMPLSGGKPQDETDENAARIIYTPANHFSRRGAFDMNKALWGSWTVIGSKGHKFWFGGDTAYSDVFKQIGKRFGPFDFAAIPIGAYDPRETMQFVHVDPGQAVQMHNDINSKLSLGIHWATFKLTNEHYMDPKKRLLQLVDKNPDMKPFKVVNIGETLEA